MSRWKRYRERRHQKQIALQLLTLSGAIRPSNVEPRYYGVERTMAGACNESRLQPAVPEIVIKSSTSMWSMDVGHVLQACLNKVSALSQWQRTGDIEQAV